MRMKVGILTGSVSPAAGGTFEVVRNLARGLHRPPAIEVSVFGLKDAMFSSALSAWDGIPVTALPVRGPRSFGYARDLHSAVEDASLDLVHVHGLWMYSSIAACRWKKGAAAPRLVSPHGMLDPWALTNARWKKRVATVLYEGRHLRRATCIHALCDAEAAAIRAFGLDNPLCVIPNGVSLAERPAPQPPAWRRALADEAKVLLYLGRIHPKKGLAVLLDAWAELRHGGHSCARDWHLVIAGWDQGGHRAELKALSTALNVESSVRFIGPQFNEDKHDTLCAANAIVLPSLSEGLPVVVLEAWAHRLPVLMTPYCNLPEGFAAGAALSIDPDVRSIARQLHLLCSLSDEQRRAMGDAGLNLVSRQFTWSRAAAEMGSVYRWLVGAGPRPDCVRVD